MAANEWIWLSEPIFVGPPSTTCERSSQFSPISTSAPMTQYAPMVQDAGTLADGSTMAVGWMFMAGLRLFRSGLKNRYRVSLLASPVQQPASDDRFARDLVSHI